MRNALKEDLGATAAELVYGAGLRLPAELFHASNQNPTSDFVEAFKKRINNVKPSPTRRHSEKNVFIFKDLTTTPYVFLRHDAIRGPSDPPYDGPYKVLERNDKSFVIDINGKKVRVSIDRLKPAFIVSDDIENNVNNKCNRECYDEVDYDIVVQRNCDKDTPPFEIVPAPDNTEQLGPHNINCNNNEAPVNVQQPCPANKNRFTTRSGRNVHFPDRYQAGF
ncbi:uncharacterized protein LOC131672838 [Phymastichus coffea]|uniref:uncharacterized protein LOC131672838 n=1 Tax=Phymastichus coffea TaxID=108790 RepID=UPI00273A7964|nr:uncharacterized protein LOC131672838 [Phymastichus coffea]